MLIMKIVFATNNANKVKEVQSLLPDNLEIISLQDIGCTEDIPETSPTIEGNAIQKAKYITNNYGHDCFADDTGLEVMALNGAPGVLSARYAGNTKDAEANMSKLLNNLNNVTNREAQFKTVISLSVAGKNYTFTGICKGKITEYKRGTEGFGYDPIFLPDGYTETFAEMPLSLKNQIGHRGKAVQQLINFLKQLNA